MASQTPTPPALGDSEVKYRLVRETHPVPTTRKELLALFESVIALGGVQKLLLQVGQPMKVDRFVAAEQPGDAPPIDEIQDEDWYYASRNAEMKDLIFTEQQSPYEYLFKAFQLSTSKGHSPAAFLISKDSILRNWLGVDDMFPLEKLFGVPVIAHPAIPADSSLLVSEDSEGKVVFSVRLEIDIPKPKAKKEKSK